MRTINKVGLALAVATAVISSNKGGYKSLDLHLPTGEKNIAGYHYDLTGNTVHGTATPVSFTDKYVCAWIGDYSATISKTDKWYTEDESENWSVWTFEILKGEDDAWFVMEFGK